MQGYHEVEYTHTSKQKTSVPCDEKVEYSSNNNFDYTLIQVHEVKPEAESHLG
jgi:hypothetical protein